MTTPVYAAASHIGPSHVTFLPQLLPPAFIISNSTTIHATGAQTAVAVITPDQQYKTQSHHLSLL